MKQIYKKILFATDGSKTANRAAEKLIEFYKSWKCKLVIFHSIKHVCTFSVSLYNDIEKEGNRILKEAKKIFESAQIPVEIRLIKRYEPEDYITSVVEKENFDLVILGINGFHSKFSRIIIGSVAERVIKRAACDVLVVK